ncbi:MAG: serine/threonine-protein kinase, partial [Myxococcota bacterium]
MAEQKFPRRFGRYILLDKVNSGGMAEVYRARVSGADNFQRIVAIKCMLGSLADDPEFATMFIDEARLAAQLNHGNIVQIYELGRHEHRLYIAMELVSGHDLRNTTKRARKLGKRLGVGFVAYIIAKAAEALDYAHNKLSLEGTPLNLVHRDVSPQNILVSYDGEVKVVDFGIAKAEHRATETRAGTLKGKFAYMAPEQVAGAAIDRRADIFAMGAVLYEAATGRPLFYGDTDLAILEKVRKATLPNLEEHLSHAPAQLCKVIRKACALDPNDRYQSALDMAEDLSPVLISRGNLFG